MQSCLKFVALVLWAAFLLPSYADQKRTEDDPVGWDKITLKTVPPELKSFWEPMIKWQKGLYDPKANEQSMKEIAGYCVHYSEQYPDPSQIRFMILDLSQHPSELRAVIYGEVVVRRDRKKTRVLLDYYSNRGTPAEKAAANDFIADEEEFDRDIAKNSH